MSATPLPIMGAASIGSDANRASLRLDPFSMTSADFVTAAREREWSWEKALAAYRAVHRKGRLPDDALPHAEVRTPAITRTIVDGTTLKFTLDVGDGLETESVVIPMPHTGGGFSRTLCVSSQIGCAMGCTFCETAQMGLLRSLSPREIVAQWFVARHLVEHSLGDEDAPDATGDRAITGEPGSLRRGFEIKNIVFMGMGEPMDNLDAVLAAVEILTDRNGPCVAASNISISTVGRTDGIRRLGAFIRRPGFHRLNLAVSLNAPNDEIRSRIMPINRAEPLATLMAALREFPRRPTAAICVEYVLIPGVNDAPEHCDQVCALLKGLRSSLNVIPYNPRRDSPWRAPTEDETQRFISRAVANGQFCKRRQTKGRGAMAACGQLGNESIRRRRRVDPRPASEGVDSTAPE
ncbi:MAG: 23S rRNA (adenine(2503)-C(2))-methyltransferase RlmN [Phycisphaeraceae bacterium]|nr:23S rRNA (adenine(2503)-C(2))-methyltransferase RlmN [Phycisphaeraceae bacterium]